MSTTNRVDWGKVGAIAGVAGVAVALLAVPMAWPVVQEYIGVASRSPQTSALPPTEVARSEAPASGSVVIKDSFNSISVAGITAEQLRELIGLLAKNRPEHRLESEAIVSNIQRVLSSPPFSQNVSREAVLDAVRSLPASDAPAGAMVQKFYTRVLLHGGVPTTTTRTTETAATQAITPTGNGAHQFSRTDIRVLGSVDVSEQQHVFMYVTGSKIGLIAGARFGSEKCSIQQSGDRTALFADCGLAKQGLGSLQSIEWLDVNQQQVARTNVYVWSKADVQMHDGIFFTYRPVEFIVPSVAGTGVDFSFRLDSASDRREHNRATAIRVVGSHKDSPTLCSETFADASAARFRCPPLPAGTYSIQFLFDRNERYLIGQSLMLAVR